MKLALSALLALSPLLLTAQMDSVSHALGIIIAKSVQQQGFEIKNPDDFAAGFRAAMAGSVTPAQVQQAQMTVQQAQMRAQAAQAEANAERAAGARAEGEAFLEKNKAKEGVTVTASGLQYEVVQAGDGSRHPSATDKVTVHYTGTNLDGSVFDSSVERGQPATFPLNGVIAGWTEGVQLMTPGAKYRFYIPSDLAYGERGAGADIAPGATLIFDVELISIGD